MGREIKYVDPHLLIIVGLDEEDESSPLVDERAALPIDENLVRNIMVYGVIQPATIRMEAGKMFVVDGRQRVKAARVAVGRQSEAGEFTTKVPCITVSGDDTRVGGIMISSNELRQNDEVLIKARKAARLLGQCGDKDEVAIAFGRSTKTISNWLKLLSADPRIHEAIREGKISPNVGIKLAGKSRQEQIVALDQLLAPSPASGGGASSQTGGSGGEGTGSTPAPLPSGGGASSSRPGVKKVWLRKALKTEAAKTLSDEDRAVLEWFLTGQAQKDSWLDTFVWDVENEMGGE